MLRDELTSDLGKIIYDYSEISKQSIPPEIARELSEAFCVRENINFRSWSNEPPGIGTVEVETEESLELYSRWKGAFVEHGYSPPFLHCVIE